MPDALPPLPLFRFHIVKGSVWHHEFPIVDSDTLAQFVWPANWKAALVIKDHRGRSIARLASDGTGVGPLMLVTGRIDADLTAATTATLKATWSRTKPWLRDFARADLELTDPAGVKTTIGEGKGVVRQP